MTMRTLSGDLPKTSIAVVPNSPTEVPLRCRVATLSTADRKSTRLNSSHTVISYAVFCLKKKKTHTCSRGRNVHHLRLRARVRLALPESPVEHHRRAQVDARGD